MTKEQPAITEELQRRLHVDQGNLYRPPSPPRRQPRRRARRDPLTRWRDAAALVAFVLFDVFLLALLVWMLPLLRRHG